eukprot:6771633-Lingulodinium_polyedra.AAC.1
MSKESWAVTWSMSHARRPCASAGTFACSRGEGEGREACAPEEWMELRVRSGPSPADAQREFP